MVGDLLEDALRGAGRLPAMPRGRGLVVEHDPGQVIGTAFLAGGDIMGPEPVGAPGRKLGQARRARRATGGMDEFRLATAGRGATLRALS